MKYTTYNDIIQGTNQGLEGTEFIVPTDIISARSELRPMQNLQYNIEETYGILQNAIKTIYGNKNGIAQDTLEMFEPRNFTIGKFRNNSQVYLRIPTGLAFLRTKEWDAWKNYDYQTGLDTGNPFHFKTSLKKEDLALSTHYLEMDREDVGKNEYKDTISSKEFTQDKFSSYSIFNQPNASLMERQIANFLNMDLTDNDNNVRINISYAPAPEKIYVNGVWVDHPHPGTIESRYTLDITEVRYGKPVVHNFPFKPENTKINIANNVIFEDPALDDNYIHLMNFRVYADNARNDDDYRENIVIQVKNNSDVATISNQITSKVNLYSKYMTATYSGGNITFVFREHDKKYNDYFIKFVGYEGIPSTAIGDQLLAMLNNGFDPAINKMKDDNLVPLVDQWYFNNVFELMESFMTIYHTAMVKTYDLGDNLSLEPLVYIYPNSIPYNKIVYRYVYYNKDLIEYDHAKRSDGTIEPFRLLDKTQRFGITNTENFNDIPKGAVPLVKIPIAKNNNDQVFFPWSDADFIKEHDPDTRADPLWSFPSDNYPVVPLLDLFDRRTLYTKQGMFNSIRVDTRTELVNWLHYKDREDDPLREIEITGGKPRTIDGKMNSDTNLDPNNNSNENRTLMNTITSPIVLIQDEKDKLLRYTVDNVPFEEYHVTNGGLNFINLKKDPDNTLSTFVYTSDVAADDMTTVAGVNAATGNIYTKWEMPTLLDPSNKKYTIGKSFGNGIDIIANKYNAQIWLKVTKDTKRERINSTGRYYIESQCEDQFEIKQLYDGIGTFGTNTTGLSIAGTNIVANKNKSNIYFSNSYRNKVAKIRILEDGTFILQNHEEGSIKVTDGETHGPQIGLEVFNALRIDTKYNEVWDEPTPDGYEPERQKLVTVFGHIYPNINALINSNSSNVSVTDINRSQYGNDIGASLNEVAGEGHRFRNLFVRNIYSEIIQLDKEHHQELRYTSGKYDNAGIDYQPRIGLDLNDSNVNNVAAIYFKRCDYGVPSNGGLSGNYGNGRRHNFASINWNRNIDNTDRVDSLYGYSGTLQFVSSRDIGRQISNPITCVNSVPAYAFDADLMSNLGNAEVITDANNIKNKKMLNLDNVGTLSVKNGLIANGGLRVGQPTQPNGLITSKFYGDLFIYPSYMYDADKYGSNKNTFDDSQQKDYFKIFGDETGDSYIKQDDGSYSQTTDDGGVRIQACDSSNPSVDRYTRLYLAGNYQERKFAVYLKETQSTALDTAEPTSARHTCFKLFNDDSDWLYNTDLENVIIRNQTTSAAKTELTMNHNQNILLNSQANANAKFRRIYINRIEEEPEGNTWSIKITASSGNLRPKAWIEVIDDGRIRMRFDQKMTLDGDVDVSGHFRVGVKDKPPEEATTNEPLFNHRLTNVKDLSDPDYPKELNTATIVDSKGELLGPTWKNSTAFNGTNEGDVSAIIYGGMTVAQSMLVKWNLGVQKEAVFNEQVILTRRDTTNTAEDANRVSSGGNITRGATLWVKAGSIYAGYKVFNAVWNDVADYIDVEEGTPKEFGKVYVFNGTKHSIASKRAQKGAVGISSDTHGISTGHKEGVNQIPVAIGGFVLAYVDKVYPSGTELVSDKNGNLTKANWFESVFNRQAIVGIFYKVEKEKEWNGVIVNGRNWVKAK